VDVVVAATADEWRAWLDRHARTEREAWLVIHHQRSGTPSVRYDEAVEQALCFGWIDGLHRRHDATSSVLRFSPRSARSRWSARNRERAARMVEQGLMTELGQAEIDKAKARGTWDPEADGAA
jgi:uncharacterized protein YdeI (YjbR/CyaY-like superfamily)